MALYAFDGTWNTDSDDVIDDTNVVRFRDLYMGNVCYLEGVGTRLGVVGKVLGGLLGVGGRSRIEEMTENLKENFEAGDTEIDVIGFSRGAALAVHFTNQLAEEGITLKSGDVVKPRIRFLGLWDVVGSFGLSFDTIINFNDINLGWDIDSVSSNVDKCAHAMALDERRETFGITRLNEEAKFSNITECWFRGVHSDIGGGNRNTDRSNIALQWLLEQAESAGVRIDQQNKKLSTYHQTDRYAPISENQDVKVDPRRIVLDSDNIHPTAHSLILQSDESHVTSVLAKYRFNWSGVHLEEGKKYTISVDAGEQWQDKEIECSADGWRSDELSWYKEALIEKFEKNRRCPEANWFELIGAYGDSEENIFRIGTEKTFTATQSGDLYLFANDLKSKYDNNSGSIAVSISRSD